MYVKELSPDFVHQKNEKAEPALVDIFEDAIDDYGIVEFVNADYPFVPPEEKTLDVILGFIKYIRDILPSHRRQPQTNTSDIIDFVSYIELYLNLIKKNKGGEKYAHLPNADKDFILENVANIRRAINETYSSINEGGLIYISK